MKVAESLVSDLQKMCAKLAEVQDFIIDNRAIFDAVECTVHVTTCNDDKPRIYLHNPKNGTAFAEHFGGKWEREKDGQRVNWEGAVNIAGEDIRVVIFGAEGPEKLSPIILPSGVSRQDDATKSGVTCG